MMTMSAESCLFNLFPIEILDLIFEYLSASDLVYAFLNLTPYINKIISNYHFYQINFESISKWKFDLICRHIQAHQIKSLTLSDGDETPYQSKLFFSIFTIDDLAFHLSYLSLINIDNQSMELIFNNIHKFERLLSLKRINSSNLNQLNISNENLFSNLMRITNLQALILTNPCTFSQFQILLNYCLKLASLNILLEKDISEKISGIYLNLKKLTINMSSKFDHYQWELYITSNLRYLKVFNFKFQFKSTLILNNLGIENILRTYSTSFWLNEKR